MKTSAFFRPLPAALACAAWASALSAQTPVPTEDATKIKVLSSRTETSLPDISAMGLQQSTIRPKADDSLFVVVKLELPLRHLLPSEAKYLEMKRKAEQSAQKGKPQTFPVREHCRSYDPERFRLTLANGVGCDGEVIRSPTQKVFSGSEAGFSSGFSQTNFSETPVTPAELEKMESLEVGFIVKKKDLESRPYRLKFGTIETEVPAAGGAAVAATLPPVKEPVLRTWTNASGRTMEARFLSKSADGQKGRFQRKDGKEYEIPLDTLSPADQEWIRSQGG